MRDLNRWTDIPASLGSAIREPEPVKPDPIAEFEQGDKGDPGREAWRATCEALCYQLNNRSDDQPTILPVQWWMCPQIWAPAE